MKISILIFTLLLSTFSWAEGLTIGCTSKCDLFMRRAIKKAARLANVQVTILNLEKSLTPLRNVDGVLVPGGADISPEYYLNEVESELREYTKSHDYLVNYSKEGKRRDPFEYNLLKNYFADESLKDLPVLGVCRGMQMLAVSQGIPLYLDIKHELGIRNRRYLWDRIYVEKSENLMNHMFNDSFWGFKRHHQGIRVDYFDKNKERWPHIEITSYSNRGLIAESIEFSNRPVFAVQFHPENDFGYERRTIFSWLIDKAILSREKKMESLSPEVH